MDISVIRNIEEFKALRSEWNQLIVRAETNTIFQTYEWHLSWLEAFGARAELMIVLLREKGGLIGIAPLAIHEQKINWRNERVLGFIGTSNFCSDYCDFITPKDRPDVLHSFLDWLRDNKENWTVLNLYNIPGQTGNLADIHNYYRETTDLKSIEFLYDAPTLIFTTDEENQKLLNKKSLKRHYNYFKRTGELDFAHSQNESEILEYLGPFFQQHISRWADVGVPSPFSDSAHQMFYTSLVKNLLPTGWLRFSRLLFNKQPIAFHFGFEYCKSYIWYKPTFDIALKAKSPGEVLIKYLLEYAVSQKLREFDFTIGSEPFKYRFSNHVRSTHRVRIFKRPLSYFLMRSRSAVRHLKDFFIGPPE